MKKGRGQALCFLQYFDTDGWVVGRTLGRKSSTQRASTEAGVKHIIIDHIYFVTTV